MLITMVTRIVNSLCCMGDFPFLYLHIPLFSVPYIFYKKSSPGSDDSENAPHSP